MTDFSKLCAELLAHAQTAQAICVGEGLWDGPEDEGLFARATAALSERVVGPAAPSDEELLNLADDSDLDRFEGERGYPDGTVIKEGCWEAWDHELLAFARAVLARWGTTPTPVAVAERLPGDQDDRGRLWVFDDMLWLPSWTLIKVQGNEDMPSLPFHALPLPEVKS